MVWRHRASIRTRPICSRDLELPDQEFKTAIIDMLRTLMNTADSRKEQMGNVSRQIEVIRIKKEMLEIKNSVTKVKNVFYGLISKTGHI